MMVIGRGKGENKCILGLELGWRSITMMDLFVSIISFNL